MIGRSAILIVCVLSGFIFAHIFYSSLSFEYLLLISLDKYLRILSHRYQLYILFFQRHILYRLW